MYASGLLPRRIAIIGLVGGSLAFVAATGALFGVYDRQPQILLSFPEMIWEMTFGIYLVAKGFTAPRRRRPAPARHTPAPAAALG
jgi:uncharacterized protein DUF4386